MIYQDICMRVVGSSDEQFFFKYVLSNLCFSLVDSIKISKIGLLLLTTASINKFAELVQSYLDAISNTMH